MSLNMRFQMNNVYPTFWTHFFINFSIFLSFLFSHILSNSWWWFFPFNLISSIFFTVICCIMSMNLMNKQEWFMAAIYMTFVENIWIDFFYLLITNKMCVHSMYFVFCLSFVFSFSWETFSLAYLFFTNVALVKLWIVDIFVVLC